MYNNGNTPGYCVPGMTLSAGASCIVTCGSAPMVVPDSYSCSENAMDLIFPTRPCTRRMSADDTFYVFPESKETEGKRPGPGGEWRWFLNCQYVVFSGSVPTNNISLHPIQRPLAPPNTMGEHSPALPVSALRPLKIVSSLGAALHQLAASLPLSCAVSPSTWAHSLWVTRARLAWSSTPVRAAG